MNLYLDVYLKGVRKVESLGSYLVPESTPIYRQQNNHTRQVAEKIKAKRILALQNHGVRQWDKMKRSCITIVDFLKEYLKHRRRPRFLMSKIGKKIIVGLLDFMKNIYRNTKSPDNPKEMSLHTLHLHQNTLIRMINVAAKEGIMDKRPLT